MGTAVNPILTFTHCRKHSMKWRSKNLPQTMASPLADLCGILHCLFQVSSSPGCGELASGGQISAVGADSPVHVRNWFCGLIPTALLTQHRSCQCHSGCHCVSMNSNLVMSEGSKRANVKIFLFTTVSKNQGTLKIVRVGDNLQK